MVDVEFRSMQTRHNDWQSEMMLLPSIEDKIPHDYYLRRIKEVLDLGFVHEMVRSLYCQDNGRPSIDPEVIIRLFLLQAITGIASVRQLLRESDLHLGYRWFIGYGANEALPDHSSLSRALSRFGDEVFNEIFEQSIAQCKASGLVEGRVLHLDATTIRADLDRDKVDKPNSSDPDARFGRFPNGTKQPGFKQQTVVDDKSRVILAIDVLPANVAEGSNVTDVLDEATGRLDECPEVVCADSAYASGENRAQCEARGVRLVSPPRRARNHHSDEYYTIERFTYDELRDMFICPVGNLLKRAGRGGSKPNRWKYRASAKDCGSCPLKSECTKAPQRCVNVSSNHASLVRLREDSQSKDFQDLYRRRSPVIEGVFAEAKQWHGLARATRRGLSKMRVQCLLVASVLNLKRLASAIRLLGGGLHPSEMDISLLHRVLRAFRGLFADTQGCLATQ